MVRCGGCGADNPAGKRFCADCGQPLQMLCPACGEPVEAGRRFCGECGAALATTVAVTTSPAVAALGPAPGPVAERRVCSVLFVDLVGFTPLSEGRDPEAVRELLSRYFEVARTIIGRYGGVVEKFIGDAVMAVWGTPTAAEGDTERAVRAALELVAAVAAMGVDVAATGLAARAGVVTDEVAVTLGATGEGMVAGDAVNTAARVQGVAPPGSVLTDATTRRLAATAISFEDAGEHMLKGKAGPEALWRAVRVVSGVGGAQRVDGLEAPLAGRDTELRTVKDLFHASAERRVPRLVVVSGEAGTGKSRLGWEFEKYIDGLANTVLWHRGRCLSYGDGVTFWALAEIVRQRFGIAEEDTAAVGAAKLAEGLIRFVPGPAERTYVGARLGRLLGLEVADDGAGLLPRQELFAGWRLFFERLAGVAPVALVIEDAHHADPGLLDFVDHLVDWVRDLPVFVLVFARPELIETRAGFGVGRNRATLTLDPLDALSMDSLVDGLVPGMAAAARGKITAQARGNPLFAVETVRSLVDRGIVAPIDGVYRLVGDIGPLAVPDSLHLLLAARLDALDPSPRALVADASVIGSTFPAEALAAVSGRPEDEIRTALAELVRRDVLELSADPLSPQRGTYRFRQDMLRQVAYDTLSRRDRKTRHLAVAANLRHVFANDGEEVAEVVARHYLDALDVGSEDADGEDIRALAIAFLVRAADRSLRAGAPGPAAVGYATAAQQNELTSDLNAQMTSADLWERAAKASRTAWNVEQTIAYAERARDAYARSGQDRSAARAEMIAAGGVDDVSRLEEVRRRLTTALTVLQPDPDEDTVRALNALATLDMYTGGEDTRSVEALVLGQELDVEPGLLATLFGNRGVTLMAAGRTAEAVAHLKYGLEVAERALDSGSQAMLLLNLSEILSRSDPVAAANLALRAAEHARRVGEMRTLNYSTGNEVAALLFAGDWDRAEQVLGRAIEIDHLSETGFLAGYLAQLAALRGQIEEATKHAATPWLRASPDPQDDAMITMCDALVAAADGRPDEALMRARSLLRHATGLGIGVEMIRWAWPLATRSALELGEVDAVTELLAVVDGYPIGHLPPLLRGERDLARARLGAAQGDPAATQHLAAAVDKLRTAISPYHLAHGLLDLAQHQMTGGETAAAAPLIEEASTIGRTLRCQPLIDRAAILEAVEPAVH